MTSVHHCLEQLNGSADPGYRERILRWFKTGPGDYAAHDRFLGVSMPRLRALAKQLAPLPPSTIEQLLQRPENEARMLAWLSLCQHYLQSPEQAIESAWRWRLMMNNWNLVDTAAPQLFGRELLRTPDFNQQLRKLTDSENLWERRISIVSCLYPVRQGEIDFCLTQARALLGDKEDLIHKATGWLLREVGKQNRTVLEQFLEQHLGMLSRTSLRYAIERFTPAERKHWLQREST